MRRIFQSAPNPPRFPMYVRQAKQFMRGVDPQFDERQYGFGTLQDLLRACQREGLFRIERDRQGVIRLFPGNIMQPSTGIDDLDEEDEIRPEPGKPAPADSVEEWASPQESRAPVHDAEPQPGGDDLVDEREHEARSSDVVDGDVVQERDEPSVVDGEEAPAPEEPKRGRGARKRTGPPRAAKKTEPAAARARKSASARPPRGLRSRKTPSE